MPPGNDPYKKNESSKEDKSGVTGFIVKNSLEISSFIVLLTVLFVLSVSSFLFFHSLAEIFSIVVAGTIFFITWNSRKILDNNYLQFLGLAYVFIGFIDLVHLLAYKGMGVWPEFDANLPTQLWIAARYLQALTLLIAPLTIKWKVYVRTTIAAYSSVVMLLLISIFVWQVFPACYVEGVGLTSFKINSEYLISAILVVSAFLLYKEREVFDKHVLRLIVFSIFTTIGSELAFTFYVSVFGFSNVIGHFLKIIAFYLIYKAIIKIGVEQPYNVIFRSQVVMNEKLSQALETVEKRTKVLRDTQEELLRIERLATLDQLAGSVGHELRNPLGGIKNSVYFLNLVLENPEPDVKKSLDIINKEVETSEKIINSLLEFARIRRPNRDKVDINEILRDTMSRVQSPENIDVELILDKDLPIFMADAVQLTQIFMKIIQNAFQAMPKGGRLKVETSTPDPKSVAIAISDTGVGISEGIISKIFEPLFTTKAKGIGLGLAITKNLVEGHKGSLDVSSEEGKGTTFTIRLPLRGESND